MYPKPHYRPTRWGSMPMSARKCYLRSQRIMPNSDGRIDGWEWIVTLKEPNKTYAVSRDWRWFVGDQGVF